MFKDLTKQEFFKKLYLSSAVSWTSAIFLETQRLQIKGVQLGQCFYHCNVQCRTLCWAHFWQREVSEDATLETS